MAYPKSYKLKPLIKNCFVFDQCRNEIVLNWNLLIDLE